MKRNTIILDLYGHPKNLQRVAGQWKDDFSTRQLAIYHVEQGLVTIESLTPVYGTQLDLPLPFTVPVNDLGSGELHQIDFNCDTMTADRATCPTPKWATQRTLLTSAPSLQQQLMADYCALL